jgi:hypothetical protein
MMLVCVFVPEGVPERVSTRREPEDDTGPFRFGQGYFTVYCTYDDGSHVKLSMPDKTWLAIIEALRLEGIA